MPFFLLEGAFLTKIGIDTKVRSMVVLMSNGDPSMEVV